MLKIITRKIKGVDYFVIDKITEGQIKNKSDS